VAVVKTSCLLSRQFLSQFFFAKNNNIKESVIWVQLNKFRTETVTEKSSFSDCNRTQGEDSKIESQDTSSPRLECQELHL